MRAIALLLPFFALMLAGSGVLAAWELKHLQRDDVEVVLAGAYPDARPEVTPNTPQLKPGQTVCQGILHRAERGAPREVPAIYKQQRDVLGIAVVGVEAIDRRAFDAAAETIYTMFETNPELLAPLVEQGSYVVIAQKGQKVDELPEFACLEEELGGEFFTHVCGIADHADYPVVAVNEADMLGDREGPCHGLNVLYHELGHLVQTWSLPPPDYFEVKLLYQDAMDAGKYYRQYAATNPNEYFADGTQAYFLHNEPSGAKDRAWLRNYDRKLYELLARVYGE